MKIAFEMPDGVIAIIQVIKAENDNGIQYFAQCNFL